MFCKSCNKATVEKLDTGELVCTSCGLVIDDFVVGPSTVSGNFVSFDNKRSLIFANQSTSQSVRHKVQSTKSSILVSCQKLIRAISCKVGFGRERASIIESQFLKLYPKFKFKRSQFKHILAGCCVYSAAQASGHPILISDLCDLLSCPKSKFVQLYNKLQEEENLCKSHISRHDTVSAILSRMPYETAAQKQERSNLLQQTLKIMDFVDKCWLVTGRSIEATAIACSYIAWKNMDMKRMNIPFDHFHKEIMTLGKKYHTALERSSEISAALIKLAGYIPYVNKNSINHKNVIVYLNTILNSYETLFDALCESEGDVDENITKFRELRKIRYTSRICSVAVEENEGPPIDDKDLIPEDEWLKYLRSDEEIDYLKSLHKDEDDEDYDEEDENVDDVDD